MSGDSSGRQCGISSIVRVHHGLNWISNSINSSVEENGNGRSRRMRDQSSKMWRTDPRRRNCWPETGAFWPWLGCRTLQHNTQTQEHCWKTVGNYKQYGAEGVLNLWSIYFASVKWFLAPVGLFLCSPFCRRTLGLLSSSGLTWRFTNSDETRTFWKELVSI